MQKSTLLFVLGLCVLSQTLFAQTFTRGRALLSGQQQALPVVTAAQGTARVNIVNNELGQVIITVVGEFSDLSSPVDISIGGGAHIHRGLPGENGPILLSLNPTLSEDSLSGTFTSANNTFVLEETELEDLEIGELYINVHTRNHPGGEIRGTVGDIDREHYFANLLGSNEVPSVLSSAAGAVFIEFNPDNNELFLIGSYDGLTDEVTGQHLHLGLPGQNGPVVFPLEDTTPEDDLSGEFRPSDNNVFTLTDEQADALRAGRMYVNVHSEVYPAGEIRGQVLPPAHQLLRAHLSGANEWPVVTTLAHGEVLGHVVGDSLRIIGSFHDLSTPVAVSIAGGAHLHTGYAGQNGPVIIPLAIDFDGNTSATDSLSGVFMLADNRYELDDDQRALLLNRGIYFNLHSTAHPAGELRGQMLPEAQAVFTSFLNGNQQIPPVATTGRGMVKVERMGTRLTATGSFTELTSDLNVSIGGGAHLHAGYPGQSGPVIYPLAVSDTDDDDDARSGLFLPDSNTFTTTAQQVADTLYDRFFYTNIHTLDHPGGEIRGHVLAEAQNYFLAPLSGASQPDGVPTDATGMIAAEQRDTMVALVGSFQDLDSDFNEDAAGGAHLHMAIAGSNGAIVVPIAVNLGDGDDDTGDSERRGVVPIDSNHIGLDSAQLTAMLDRMIYVNIHTDDNPNGAIRGQVLPLAGSYYHVTLSGVNSVDYVATTAQGGFKLELIDSMLMVSGSVRMLQGDFDASIGGGAHLHFGTVNMTGDVTIPLNADVSGDLKAATFTVDSNTFMLDSTQFVALRSDSLYANIHTTTQPAGEARGQVLDELNLFPTMPMIVAPMDGDSLTLEGNDAQAFAARFSPSTDANGDSIAYVWQLATDEDFETIIFAARTGSDTAFVTDFATVDQLLADNGVAENESITLYHRALATDGSNHTAGSGVSVALSRGMLVGVNDYRPEGFAASVFPTPSRAGTDLTYELETREAFRGELRLYSALGQLVHNRRLEASVGTQRLSLTTTELTAGTYFLQLTDEAGRPIHTSRVVLR